MAQPNMSCEQADRLSYYLQGLDGVSGVKVFERTADAVVCYTGEREALLTAVQKFHYEEAEVPEGILKHSGRQLSRMYQEKLMKKIIFRAGSKFFCSVSSARSAHQRQSSPLYRQRNPQSCRRQTGRGGSGRRGDRCFNLAQRF